MPLMINIKVIKKRLPLFILFILFFFINNIHAATSQPDSLIMKNGDVIVGEIKNMDKGVLTIETPYSDEDFKIEWEKINKIFCKSFFLITLENGKRINGSLKTLSNGKILLEATDEKKENIVTVVDSIVFLKSVDKGFWDRFSASLDIGFNLAKSNNMKQFTVQSNFGYTSSRWGANVNFNTLLSTQDDVDNIKRYDGSLNYKHYLPKSWYLPITVSFLSNTEQSIMLRTVGQIGAGLYVVQTNQIYWGVQMGISFNNEQYFTDDPKRNSFEIFFGSEYNMFNFNDLSVLAKTTVYSDVTEKNHWRSDVGLDFKYDMPLDFYVKTGFTLNFDNKPVETGTKTDYVLNIGFGWSW
jgi:hypothetical protein